MKRAVALLVENNVLLQTADQYRITSQIEQQIIDAMSKYEIPVYRQKAEIISRMKQLRLVKAAQGLYARWGEVQFLCGNQQWREFCQIRQSAT